MLLLAPIHLTGLAASHGVDWANGEASESRQTSPGSRPYLFTCKSLSLETGVTICGGHCVFKAVCSRTKIHRKRLPVNN